MVSGFRITLVPGWIPWPSLQASYCETRLPVRGFRPAHAELDVRPISKVSSTYLVHGGTGFGSIHKNPGPRHITTYSITMPTPVNTGSRLLPQTQVPSWSPCTQAAGLPSGWSMQQACSLEDFSCNPTSWHHQRAHSEPLDGLTGEGFCLLKPVCTEWKRCLLPQMCRHQCKATRMLNK